MGDYFVLDKRLGIHVPDQELEWDNLPLEKQQLILLTWETIRGSIPDQIANLETMINTKQAELSDENDFVRSCLLNSEISELASIINDLWLWFRTHQNITEKMHY